MGRFRLSSKKSAFFSIMRILQNSALCAAFLVLSFAVGYLIWQTFIKQTDVPKELHPTFKQNRVDNEIDSDFKSTSVVWPKVVLFGDSLTEFSFSPTGTWGAILADRLQRRADVVLRGFGGYNTRMAKAMLPSIFDSFGSPVPAITVFFGANDANPRTNDSNRRVPVEEYKENLKWIVNYLEKGGIGKEKIILISPPVFDAKRWSESRNVKPPINDKFTAAYAAAAGKVAAEIGCEFLDWFGIMEKEHPDTWKSFLRGDGLHFSPKGSEVLADALWPMIERRTLGLPYIMPSYQTMNNLHPDVTIAGWLESYQAP